MKLYITNKGRNVEIDIGNIHLTYTGPKNLVRFKEITKVKSGCLYINTVFRTASKQYVEEDYVDIKDILLEYNYNADEILKNITDYIIRESENGELMENISKMDILTKSLLVSDNIAFFHKTGTANDLQLVAINASKPSLKATIRFSDGTILSSNMNEKMLNRTKAALKRNYTILKNEIKERQEYA